MSHWKVCRDWVKVADSWQRVIINDIDLKSEWSKVQSGIMQ